MLGRCAQPAGRVVTCLTSTSELRPRIPANAVAEVLVGGTPSDACAPSSDIFEEREMIREPTYAAHINQVARTPKYLWAECPPRILE